MRWIGSLAGAAVVAAKEYAVTELGNPSPRNFSTTDKDEIWLTRKRKALFIFFKQISFERGTAEKVVPDKYDLIYDYTVSRFPP